MSLQTVEHPRRWPKPRLQLLLEEVARQHMVTPKQMRAHGRVNKRVVAARWEFFYRAFAETQATLCAIGHACRRDHSTVWYGIQRHSLKFGYENPRGKQWKIKVHPIKGRRIIDVAQAKALYAKLGTWRRVAEVMVDPVYGRPWRIRSIQSAVRLAELQARAAARLMTTE